VLSEDSQDKFECMLQVSVIKLSLLFCGRQNSGVFYCGNEEDHRNFGHNNSYFEANILGKHAACVETISLLLLC